MICTLGNFSTKLLRDDPTGITRLHGQPEVRTSRGMRAVRLYPLFHPAAALYTPRMLDTLREDFARIPAVLELPPPPAPEPAVAVPEPEPELAVPTPELVRAGSGPQESESERDQLGLF